MALNFKQVQAVSSIPSRVRGSGDTAERDAIFKEFFQLLDMARASDTGMVAVTIEGESECNKYSNALQAFKSAHPGDWACLNTAGGKYENKRMVSTNLYAAARPHERKLATLVRDGVISPKDATRISESAKTDELIADRAVNE